MQADRRVMNICAAEQGMSGAMLASVIILNWNGLDVLGPCLAAIEANTGIDDYEVIVLDNGSAEPGVEEAVRPYDKVRLIKEPVNHGFSRGNNIAARHARGEYLVILNNDTVPAPGWLRPLIEALRGDVGIVGGRLVDHDGRTLFAGTYFNPAINAYATAFRNYPPGAAGEPRECEAYIACGIAMRRDLFESVGGFDENYFQGYEDIDLCLRVRERGLRVMYCPESVIEHAEHASMNKMQRGDRRRSKENNREYFERRWRQRIHEFRLPHARAWVDDFTAQDRLDDALLQAVVDATAAGARVLHVGCGTGLLGERLRAPDKAMHVTGIESDAAAAALARARLDEVIFADAESAPLQALHGRFDSVLFSCALEKARDPWGFLLRLRECLDEGGTVVARFHNATHYKLVKRMALRDWRYEPAGVLDQVNLRFFSRGSLDDLFTFAGFEVIQIEGGRPRGALWRLAGLFSRRAPELFADSYLVTAKRRPAPRR
jgi:GT2 family glycosyltransferase/predicted RNA methylase